MTASRHEIPVKEILPDGTLVNMTRKEAAVWRKSIKSKIDRSGRGTKTRKQLELENKRLRKCIRGLKKELRQMTWTAERMEAIAAQRRL